MGIFFYWLIHAQDLSQVYVSHVDDAIWEYVHL